MAAGEVHSSKVAKGIHYLIATQRHDGTWDEDQYTGTGFPKYFMIKYHIYRNCFPLMALGTFRNLTTEKKLAASRQLLTKARLVIYPQGRKRRSKS